MSRRGLCMSFHVEAKQEFLLVLQPSAVSSHLQRLSSAELCGTAPEIAASEVQICRNADGSPVVLGKGSFGQVHVSCPPLWTAQKFSALLLAGDHLQNAAWLSLLPCICFLPGRLAEGLGQRPLVTVS